MIPTTGNTAINDPSIGPPQQDPLDPNISMSSGTSSQPDSAVADNTHVSDAGRASGKIAVTAGTKAGTDEDQERGAHERDVQPTESRAGRHSRKISVTGLITTSAKGEVLIFDAQRNAVGDDDDDTSNNDVGSKKSAVTNNGHCDEDKSRHSSVIPSFSGQAKMKMRNAGMMVVKLSDFDALKMKLEELEESQKTEMEAQKREMMEHLEILQRAEMEVQKREMEVQKREMEAQKREMERLEMLQRAQKEEIESQKQRIQELEASHEENRALIPVEIPHGADNLSPTHETSSNLATGHGQTFFRRRMSSIFRNYHLVSNSGGGDDDENGNALEGDTFSLMMISNVRSRSWALGTVAFSFQIVLGAMIAMDQHSLSTDSSLFDVPFQVKSVVRVGQFLTIILCLSTQSDILTSIQSVLLLGKGSDWDEVIGETGQKSTSLWIIRILVPNLLKFMQGFLVTYVSFVIIVQSDDIIDLLKDFTALMVLSETDNILFDLAGYGYLGEELMDQVAKVSDIKVPEKPGEEPSTATADIDPTSSSPSTRRCRKLHSAFLVRYLVLLSLFGLMLGFWIAIVVNQMSGIYFYMKYPNCNFTYQGQDAFKLAKKHFGDDTCWGGPLNTLDCAFEGGDCINFNIAYPLCKGRDDLTGVQSSVGNGKCDPLFMIPECDFDGGDCCPYSIFNSPLHGDGQCHGGMFATPECLFDKGDCNAFNAAYPQCPLSELGEIEGAEDFVVGDDVCDGIYSSVECGWENGDCDVGQVGQDLIVEGLDTFPLKSVVVGRKWTMGIHSGGKASVYHYNGMQRRWNPLGNLPTRGAETIVAFAISTNHAGDDRVAITSYPSEQGFLHGSSPGQVRVFDYVASDQTWAQVGQIINGEEIGSAMVLGIDITADGSRLVISAPINDYYAGAAGICIYEWNIEENWWDLVGNVIEGKEDIGLFSTHISSDDGNTVIFNSGIGFGDDTMSRIYRYDQDSQDWVQLGSDILSPYDVSPAISSDGTRIVVSSNAGNMDAPGEVKVFDFDEIDNSWLQIGTTITSAQSKNGDGFGSRLALSSDGNILAISSADQTCYDCGKGSVQIYVFISSHNKFISAHPRLSWNGNVIVDRDRDRDNTHFGVDLSMSGDGWTLSIMGYNLIDKQGFVRAYDLNQLFYMGCLVNNPYELGNSVCDDRYPENSEQCGFEDGDCPLPSPVEDYPGCMVSYPDKIGNGVCDWRNLPMYNTTECGYDGGDCLPKPVNGYPDCNTWSEYHDTIGNGICDSWLNVTECGYDGGDCLPKPVEGYPGCLVPTPDKIGNGQCDSRRDPSYNTTECGYDGGDCIPKPVEGYPGCLVLLPDTIGNGICNYWDPSYNTTECGYDGGDCLP